MSLIETFPSRGQKAAVRFASAKPGDKARLRAEWIKAMREDSAEIAAYIIAKRTRPKF